MKLKTPAFPRKSHHTAAAPQSVAQYPAPTTAQYPAPTAAPAPVATTAAPVAALKKAPGGIATATRKRNAAAMIAGLAFIIIAGAIGASVASSFDDSIDVLVAAYPIDEGQPISEDSFRVVQIAAGAGDIQAVSPASIDELVGRVAAGPIGEGSMIHPDQFALAYEDQQIVVGAALDANQYPAGGLKVGDKVRLIALAGRASSDDDEGFATGREVAIGEIAHVTVISPTSLHFSIRVPESSANIVAQLIANDQLSLGLLDQSIEVDVVDPQSPADAPAPLTLDTEDAE